MSVFDISLDMRQTMHPLLEIANYIYSAFVMFIGIFPHDALATFINEWSPYSFINMKDSTNHTIKLIPVLAPIATIIFWTGEQ